VTPTAGQTVGPFFGFALPFPGDAHLVPPGSPRAVPLSGRVLDGAGSPVPDALLEIWQADEDGVVPQVGGSLRRDGHTFTGWGRAATDNDGRFHFTTVRPSGFIAIAVFARGLGHRLLTRAYPPGRAPDALLSALTAERRATLLLTEEAGRLVFDIQLQGPQETVFLRFPGEQP
jgi:protocatechuate 3,4-dioxygenase alpha subunit